MSLQAQRERRNALVQQAKHLNAEHGEKWTPDLQKQYDALVTEIGQIDDSIARQQRLLDLEADKAFENLLQRPGAGGAPATKAALPKSSVMRKPASRSAWWITGAEKPCVRKPCASATKGCTSSARCTAAR